MVTGRPTHWAFLECLERFPKIQVDTTHQRFIVSGNRLTGGGISSGLDEALELITLLFDKATATGVQVTVEYFPKPPRRGSYSRHTIMHSAVVIVVAQMHASERPGKLLQSLLSHRDSASPM